MSLVTLARTACQPLLCYPGYNVSKNVLPTTDLESRITPEWLKIAISADRSLLCFGYLYRFPFPWLYKYISHPVMARRDKKPALT